MRDPSDTFSETESFSSTVEPAYYFITLIPSLTTRCPQNDGSFSAVEIVCYLHGIASDSEHALYLPIGLGGTDTNTEQSLLFTLDEFLNRHSDKNLEERVYNLSPEEDMHGAFSDMFTGLLMDTRNSETKVSVKKLRAPIRDDKMIEKALVKEMYFWSRMSHPNILPFLGIFLKDSCYPSLVSRWMENGTILNYLDNHPEADLLNLITGIAEAVHYLHKNKVVHSDLRPDNVLISETGKPLLRNIGLPRILEASSFYQLTGSCTTNGSYQFMAPELLRLDDSSELSRHSQASDVWAFGMTTLLTRKPPYYPQIKREVQVISAVTHGTRPSLPGSLEVLSIQNQKVWAMCNLCWHSHLQQRPPMSYIVRELKAMQIPLSRSFDLQYLQSRKIMYQDDPSGSFLRIFFPNGVHANDSSVNETVDKLDAPCSDEAGNVHFVSLNVDGTVQPGKFVRTRPGWRSANAIVLNYNGSILGVDGYSPFSILPFIPDVMELVKTSQGRIPDGRIPIVGGFEDGKVLYHAAACIEGVLVPGKTAEYLGGAMIEQYGLYHITEEPYDILCWKN